MTIAFKQIGPTFVAEATGVDIGSVLSPSEVAQIREAALQYGVLVFRDQDISDEQQIAFSEKFGPIEDKTGGNIRANERVNSKINDISNLDASGATLMHSDRQRFFNLANRLWHSDSSFRQTPASYSFLSGRIIPECGGNTEFADMRAAYDALNDRMKADVENMICEHSLLHSRGELGFEVTDEERLKFAPVRQRLVRAHPETGRKTMFLSSHGGEIDGLPRPEARMLLRELAEHATQQAFRYAHVWRRHDLLMWDNRCTMHRACRFDESEVRDLRRTTLVGQPTL